ncbi:MAG TPA: thioesterase family protein [Trebonia sp.]|nr:thioesterase family protein [Trebonia sp.]
MTVAVPGVDMSPEGDSAWRARLADRWNVGRNQNGGVLLSVVSAALAESAGHPHPLAVTGHYLRPTEAADAVVRTDLVKPGRTYSTATGELWQGDRARLQVTGSFGDLAAHAGEEAAPYAAPPPVPPPGECDDLFPILTAGPAGERALNRALRNYEIRVAPGRGWGPDQAGRPSLSGWVRFRDADTVTAAMLIALADAFPPSVMSARTIGWLPTIDLSVHGVGLPGPGEPWLLASLRTSAITGGLLDEDGELWDTSGRLVARFRQLAMILPPG